MDHKLSRCTVSNCITKIFKIKIMKNLLFCKHYFQGNYDLKNWKYFCVCYKNSEPQHHIWFYQYFRIFRPFYFFEIVHFIECAFDKYTMDRDMTVLFPPLFSQNTVIWFFTHAVPLFTIRKPSLGRWVSTEENYINSVTQQLFNFEIVATCVTRL